MSLFGVGLVLVVTLAAAASSSCYLAVWSVILYLHDFYANLLKLLVQVLRPLVKANHTGHSDRRALQIGNTARHPIGTDTHGRELVDARFGAEVVDLGLGGIEFEEGVVYRAGDGGGQRVGGFAWVAVDGGDGGVYDRGPFGVGVASCCGHCSGRVFYWEGFGDGMVGGGVCCLSLALFWIGVSLEGDCGGGEEPTVYLGRLQQEPVINSRVVDFTGM